MRGSAKLAVIGGSGLYSLGEALSEEHVLSPWSKATVTVTRSRLNGQEILFLPRHGKAHRIPPHQIPYRDQIWALRELQADTIIAVNAVGGIHPDCLAGSLVIPDQIIDYTWGRPHTFFDGLDNLASHCDFTEPYHQKTRLTLLEACRQLDFKCRDGATYACTQGPRLETRAEIRKLANDGADIVGMTGMPEAALAREAGLAYASLALVVNAAAGLGGDNLIIDDIRAHLEAGIERVIAVLHLAVQQLATERLE